MTPTHITEGKNLRKTAIGALKTTMRSRGFTAELLHRYSGLGMSTVRQFLGGKPIRQTSWMKIRRWLSNQELWVLGALTEEEYLAGLRLEVIRHRISETSELPSLPVESLPLGTSPEWFGDGKSPEDALVCSLDAIA